MRRLLLIVGALALVFVALALFGLYALESGAGKDRIARALSSALHQPVALGGIRVSLLPTPALDATGIRLGREDQNRGAAPGVAIAGVHLVPELSSLLPGRTPVMRYVELVGLVLSVRRDSTGRWLVPLPPLGGAATAPGASGRSAGIELRDLRVRDGTLRVVDDSLRAPSGGPTVTAITQVAARMQVGGGGVTVPTFTGRLGRTSVSGSSRIGTDGIRLHLASESLRNEDLPALFALAGMRPYPGLAIAGNAPVEMTTVIAPDFKTFSATGKAATDQVTLGTITLQRLRSPFRYERGTLTLDPIAFTLYGGRQEGRVTVDLKPRPPVFAMRSTVAGLDVNKALSANTSMKDELLGTARLTADVRGSGTSRAAIERTLAGTVGFALANGAIRDFPLLRAINQALGVTAGTANEVRFDSLAGRATLGGGQARVTELVLRAGDLSLAGQGTLGFDRSLDFRLVARLSAARPGQLARAVELAKRLQNAQGQIELPITVTGTVGAPKFNVDVRSIATKQLDTELQKQVERQLKKSGVPAALQDKLKGLLPRADSARDKRPP
jgi:uncharacterized protein involved in outer membrane biogenesis